MNVSNLNCKLFYLYFEVYLCYEVYLYYEIYLYCQIYLYDLIYLYYEIEKGGDNKNICDRPIV